jgi:RNA polymerase sigma factor (sigma-70 family)
MLRRVRSCTGGDDVAVVSDAELLRRFQSLGDEAAFELLVWRHGPMVLGVCSRILHDLHAAEDAFQATFLTLARKAASIGVRDAVPGWLYTVARRIALAARTRYASRATHELPGSVLDTNEPAYLPPDRAVEQEERELLQAEIDRLPDAFRSVVILCCLEGLTRAEAAQALGVPMGTVESRLVRARDRLRRGLMARGVIMAAAPFALYMAGQTGQVVPVSPALVYATLHLAMMLKIGALAAAGTAVELFEVVSRSSRTAVRLKMAAAIAAAALVAFGAGVLWPAPTCGAAPPMRADGFVPLPPTEPANSVAKSSAPGPKKKVVRAFTFPSNHCP